jgi:hypothetical protein
VLDWRRFLEDARIDYIDRGKNTSRGNINIGCPFCGDDPSYHLAISETKEAYYCFRQPNAHSGSSLNRLLVRLGVAYADIPEILNEYQIGGPVSAPVTRPVAATEKQWDQFANAADSPACMTYLAERGFPTPVAIARQYDLRFSPAGTWARRLIFPLKVDSGRSWVGRAIDHHTPKYLAESTEQTLLYVPRMVRDIVVLVEGAFDALKISVATEAHPISAIGLMGKGFSPKKLILLEQTVRLASQVLIALDADVGIGESYQLVNELVAILHRPVTRLELPYGVKDPGEMSLNDIRDWLLAIVSNAN